MDDPWTTAEREQGASAKKMWTAAEKASLLGTAEPGTKDPDAEAEEQEKAERERQEAEILAKHARKEARLQRKEAAAELARRHKELCKIFQPSTLKVLRVESSQLQPLPEGYKMPRPLTEEDDPEAQPRLCICDEVGKMCLLSLKMPETLKAALDAPRKYPRISAVFGTLPQTAKGQRDHEAVEHVKKRPDVKIYNITRNNRDERFNQVYLAVRNSLGLGEPGTSKAAIKRREKMEALKREQEEKERAERERKERQEQKQKQRDAKAKIEKEKIAKQAAEAKEARKRKREQAEQLKAAAKNGIALAVEEDDDVELQASPPGTPATPVVDDVDAHDTVDMVAPPMMDVDDVESTPAPPKKAQKVAGNRAVVGTGTVEVDDTPVAKAPVVTFDEIL